MTTETQTPLRVASKSYALFLQPNRGDLEVWTGIATSEAAKLLEQLVANPTPQNANEMWAQLIEDETIGNPHVDGTAIEGNFKRDGSYGVGAPGVSGLYHLLGTAVLCNGRVTVDGYLGQVELDWNTFVADYTTIGGGLITVELFGLVEDTRVDLADSGQAS